MSLLNDSLKNISLKELCVVILFLFLIFYVLNVFHIVHISSVWIYIVLIFYFLYKIRPSFSDLKKDASDALSKNILKYVVLVVVLNIFFSYGVLYLSDFILTSIPSLNFLVEFFLSSGYLNNSLVYALGFIATVIVSPISEELIFRGVMLNRLTKMVPLTYSILIISLLFAALHAFGSMTSAFIFSMCMAVLYVKTENIFVPIFAHFLNNLFAECIVLIDSQNLIFTNDILIFAISVLAIISAIVLVKSLIHELNNIKYYKI